MNPRYYDPQPQSPQQQRFDRFQQLQEGQQRQQQLDQSAQQSMLQQLQQLYDMQQNQVMQPDKIAAMQAATQSQALQNQHNQFEQQWAQPNAMRQDELQRAQIRQMQANTDLMGRKEEPQLPVGFGMLPPELQQLIAEHTYPEYKQQKAQERAIQNAQHWGSQFEDAQHEPTNIAAATQQWGPENAQYLASQFKGRPTGEYPNDPEMQAVFNQIQAQQQTGDMAASQKRKEVMRNLQLEKLKSRLANPSRNNVTSGLFDLPYSPYQ